MLIQNLYRGQLLVGAHGSVLRLFDLSMYKPTHDGFSGCSTGTSMIGACCSPDGQIIASGAQVRQNLRRESPTGFFSLIYIATDSVVQLISIQHTQSDGISLYCIPDHYSCSSLNRMEGSGSGILVMGAVSKQGPLQPLSTQVSGTYLSIAAVALIVQLIEKFHPQSGCLAPNSTCGGISWNGN